MELFEQVDFAAAHTVRHQPWCGVHMLDELSCAWAEARSVHTLFALATLVQAGQSCLISNVREASDLKLSNLRCC